ncbi:TonB-dependent receptor [Aestuariicella hydrocarbonica]|uniref:TonB-dependent receptor n=1 Tax=Pseudomaricurvus hydrocarbonicus TaxID=1470433 RepID=A0A9E5T1W3_9GAMM|nr:TonB-dependent receptor [Aestuariicella hydrocarbonica]NHO67890.1 TonB-dependent receptor [Aestuariicella hydrocarbonica]
MSMIHPLIKASLTAAIASVIAHPLAAQTFALEEVVVTAQKRAESLQDVPISVSAMGGEKLADAGIEKVSDLAGYVPNLHMTETGLSTQLRVRGIGSGNDQGFEQSVGQYIDGIYYGRAQLIRAPFLDLERVEVLRGPQSILFGKNSVAGALNMTTAKPTEEFEAEISGAYEPTTEMKEVTAIVSGALADNLFGRIAYRSYEEDGYIENTLTNDDEPNRDENALRATLVWDASADLSITLKAERDTFDVKGRQIEIIEDETNYSGVLSGVFGAPAFDHDLDYKRQADGNDYSENELENYTLTVDYQLGENTLTAVTGYVAYEFEDNCDCDYSPAEVFTVLMDEEYSQFSQEIRLASPGGETVDWIAGAFYQENDQEFNDAIRVTNTSILPAALSNAFGSPVFMSLQGTATPRHYEQSSETWAVFAQATWNMTDTLRLTLGGRYTAEDKEGARSIDITSIGGTVDASTVIAYGALGLDTNQGSGHDLHGDRSESAFTPLINLQWDVNEDVMAYASYTTGFKAGGFSARANNVGSFEFEEEQVTSYEVGAKSTFADGAAELNIAYYYTEYEDLQISQFDGALGFNVGNAKESVVQGIELDGRWALAQGLTLGYAASYIDFEYKDFTNGNCYPGQTPDGDVTPYGQLCDYTGKSAQYTPKKTVNLSLDYVYSLTDALELQSTLDAQYLDEQNIDPNLDPRNQIDAYTTVNARLAVNADKWSVALVGKNLTDEEIVTYAGKVPLAPAGTEYGFVKNARTVAIEGRLRF